ncbi:MAG: hypothetical protein JF612_13700, partial [Planctomycetia bacterium]|nr:hypothetical protein [Planctomycetia bacterium]
MNTGNADDTAHVSGGIGFDEVTSSSLPKIQFTGLNTFVLDVLNGLDTAIFDTGDLNGAVRSNYQVVTTPGDTLVINGFDSAFPGLGDNFVVTNPNGGLGDFLAVTHVNSSFGPVTVTNTSAGAPVGRLQINGLGGDDRVTVDVSSPASDVISTTAINFDGGDGLNQLTITGTPATSVDEVIASYGPSVGEGLLRYENAANNPLMRIAYENLRFSVADLVPATTLRVHGTDGDNAINFRGSSVPGNGRVTVDAYEALEFRNKTNLILNGFAGDDTISLSSPAVPVVGLTSITVNGGDPTASDELIVNGVAG